MKGLSAGSAVAEGAGIGGQAGEEAGGGCGGDFPLCDLEKFKEDSCGGGDIGDDEVVFSVPWVADVVVDDDIYGAGPRDGLLA